MCPLICPYINEGRNVSNCFTLLGGTKLAFKFPHLRRGSYKKYTPLLFEQHQQKTHTANFLFFNRSTIKGATLGRSNIFVHKNKDKFTGIGIK